MYIDSFAPYPRRLSTLVSVRLAIRKKLYGFQSLTRTLFSR
jgi:hypothetical protein